MSKTQRVLSDSGNKHNLFSPPPLSYDSVKGRGMKGGIKGWFSLRQSQTLKAFLWWSKESAERVFPVVKTRVVFFCVTILCSLVGKSPGDGGSTCKILTTTYQNTCWHKTTPYESSKHWMFRVSVFHDFNPLNTKRRLLYLKIQFVPRSKHFSFRL